LSFFTFSFGGISFASP
jgi:hypothetical protein